MLLQQYIYISRISEQFKINNFCYRCFVHPAGVYYFFAENFSHTFYRIFILFIYFNNFYRFTVSYFITFYKITKFEIRIH